MSKCEYFVVSIDAAYVPRVVFGPSDEEVCDTEAETYWSKKADEGEEVHIMCKHHPVMQSLRAPN